MTGRSDRVFAVIVIARLFVLAVRLGYVSIKALAAAGTFQDAGQNMRVLRVVDFLAAVCVDFTLLMRKVPILLGNNGIVLTFVYRELRLRDNVHFISCAYFLFRAAAP